MGCDIHSVAQVKKDGKWVTVLQDVAGDERNYDTFAILANVRNGYGSAGCNTGDGYIPICEARGLPKDFEIVDGAYHPISAGTPTGCTYDWLSETGRQRRLAELAEETQVWMGDHSYSHHTLAQINQYMTKHGNKVTTKRGFVSEAEYLKLRGTNNTPKAWCGFISGPRIVRLPAKIYDSLEEQGALDENDEIYVQYEWKVTYAEFTNMKLIAQALEDLATKYGVGPDDVRMVFGFDN